MVGPNGHEAIYVGKLLSIGYETWYEAIIMGQRILILWVKMCMGLKVCCINIS